MEGCAGLYLLWLCSSASLPMPAYAYAYACPTCVILLGWAGLPLLLVEISTINSQLNLSPLLGWWGGRIPRKLGALLPASADPWPEIPSSGTQRPAPLPKGGV